MTSDMVWKKITNQAHIFGTKINAENCVNHAENKLDYTGKFQQSKARKSYPQFKLFYTTHVVFANFDIWLICFMETNDWNLFTYNSRMRKDSLCGINVSAGLSLFLRFHTVKVPLVWEHMNCLPSFNQYAEITGYCSEYRTKKYHWWIFCGMTPKSQMLILEPN